MIDFEIMYHFVTRVRKIMSSGQRFQSNIHPSNIIFNYVTTAATAVVQRHRLVVVRFRGQSNRWKKNPEAHSKYNRFHFYYSFFRPRSFFTGPFRRQLSPTTTYTNHSTKAHTHCTFVALIQQNYSSCDSYIYS